MVSSVLLQGSGIYEYKEFLGIYQERTSEGQGVPPWKQINCNKCY